SPPRWSGPTQRWACCRTRRSRTSSPCAPCCGRSRRRSSTGSCSARSPTRGDMRDEDCTDGELAALVLAGRKAAFAEIMRRHKEPLYRLILGHVGSPDDALDLVQESFV